MAVRTFTRPTSLNGTLALATMPEEPARSPQAAKDSAQAYPESSKNPLGAYTNPASRPGITFASQDSLPELPIPDLESTCQKYLDSLRPLQTPKEHYETKAAVAEFLRGDGPELQEKLRKYAKGKANYIEQFWYDSYLNYDNPVVLNLNPFFLLEDDPTPARNNQVTRAASLVVSALAFVRAVRKEELPPDTVRGQPLDMYQYSRLFGTARIPTEAGCQIGQDPAAKHIVVLAHGQFYWFDVLDDNSDLIISEKNLALNLQVIIDDAAQVPIQDAARGAVGVLTTENRKIWSGLRDVLQRDEGSNNSECLSIVDSALFVLCLDYTEPATGSALCMNMLCGTSRVERGVQVGTCTNRWYDKLQIIVCKNGSAGINFEHTGVDGHTVLRFASDVYTDTILRFARTINGQAPSLWASTSPDPSKRDPASFGDAQTTPHKLEWDMEPELGTALRFAETRLADLIQQSEFATLDFSAYGKTLMTGSGFSPDAFVQMAFQAAYYGLYGRIECVYEPAMTKAFYHGRTEAIRPVTDESVEFVRTFWADQPAQAKIDALRKACERHVAVTRECAKARGHDRHLYALYCLWQRGQEAFWDAPSPVTSPSPSSTVSPTTSCSPPRLRASSSGRSSPPLAHMPALFGDAGWERMNTTVLSTSNCGNPSLRHFGFGPTSGDGFGLGYIIKDGSVAICASSKHRQTERFVEGLEAYFLEVRKLLRQTQRAPSVRPSLPPPEPSERRKRRGRNIFSDGLRSSRVSAVSSDSDDEGLGGYGFFDAGLLQSALRASREEEETQEGQAGGATPVQQVRGRRGVGRKLTLVDY
ncbi:carnitine acetyl transferas-like protein [Trichodelitschia bisporula]|uniref:Carnitine acetyl transferas-like protein n=1 Tax=Trichodelitschia bisporula TaxID=703511 RepID=A0A6G1HLV4_9PEZI|nr:carnitine acetyl transferas-like protein [Trichodelitschia bisporula]